MLEVSETNLAILKGEFDDTQSQIIATAAQLEYYKQLADQYQDEVGDLQDRLVRERSLSKRLSTDIIRVQMEAPSVRFGDGFSLVGVSMTFIMEIRPGNGSIFVNTEPLTGFDIQSSARLAAIVAQNFTGFDLSDRDITISVRTPEQVEGVDGPSAGATMTVMLIAALEGKVLRPNVMMTGTVEPGGKIGPVSGILAKAQAAFESGKTVFLIPEGLAKQTIITTSEREIFPGFKIVIPQAEEIDIIELAAERWNLTVIEVSSISEALEHVVV